MPTVTAPPEGDHRTDARARRHPVWILVAVALVAAVGIPVALVSGRADRAPVAARPELQHVLDGLTSGSGRIAPGATAYVAGPHGTWSGAAGVANAATGQPMPVDARMRLESVSKTWTAVLVLQLAEQGQLSLDDTVARWLPGLLPFGNRITLRQLLTHTSGIFDNNDAVNHPDRVLARVKDPVFRAELVRLARRIQADRPVPADGVDPAGRHPAAVLPARQRLPLLQHRLRGPRAGARAGDRAAPGGGLPAADHPAARPGPHRL